MITTHTIGRDALFCFTDETGYALRENGCNQLYQVEIDWGIVNAQRAFITNTILGDENLETLGIRIPSLCYNTSAVTVDYAEGAEGPEIAVVELSISRCGDYIAISYDDRSDKVEIELVQFLPSDNS